MHSYYITIDGDRGLRDDVGEAADRAVGDAVWDMGENNPGWHIVAVRDRRIVSERRPS